jgi:hypothetical protein
MENYTIKFVFYTNNVEINGFEQSNLKNSYFIKILCNETNNIVFTTKFNTGDDEYFLDHKNKPKKNISFTLSALENIEIQGIEWEFMDILSEDSQVFMCIKSLCNESGEYFIRLGTKFNSSFISYIDLKYSSQIDDLLKIIATKIDEHGR